MNLFKIAKEEYLKLSKIKLLPARDKAAELFYSQILEKISVEQMGIGKFLDDNIIYQFEKMVKENCIKTQIIKQTNIIEEMELDSLIFRKHVEQIDFEKEVLKELKLIKIISI